MTSLKTARLGNVTRIVGGGTPTRSNSQYYDGSIPWVTPKDMKSWHIDGSQVKITDAGLANSAARLVPAQSILIVVRSGVLKHTVPVGLSQIPVAINQDMKALLCNPEVHPDYLARFIKGKSSQILSWVRATTADNFPVAKLQEMLVPLPPLAEQRRIAEVLDKADELRVKRREALSYLDNLTQSIFLDMFGDPRSNPRRLAVEAFGDLVNEFRYGTSNKSTNTGSPALRIPNVVNGTLDLENLKTVPVTPTEFDRLKLVNGDILFVRTNGNPDYVGRCAVFDEHLIRNTEFQTNDFIYASYLIRARVDQRRIHPVFAQTFMAAAAGRAALRDRCKTSAGQYNLNIENLGSVPVLVPPLAEQLDFVERIAKVEAAKSAQRVSLAELDALFASLQDRAFRGGL
ncbi:restriction endonuclease subunit S [Micromonospora lutea]|uniref:Restriction modification system S chain-like protein n=1 Tax=Micromonospora lutea TaxID=419825 RepID=A0ABQ4ITM0_9ACTN|nr:restriction endonuclease subunit S [Micromonospora lutea]GIJ21280.1 restriction modification system S chain-like protein [Micromonospora lutea]